MSDAAIPDARQRKIKLETVRENALREAAALVEARAAYFRGTDRVGAAELVHHAADAILALIPAKAVETAVDCGPIIAGQDYRGTEFNDAAMTVEKIIADWPGLGGQELYLRFRMVFGDPQTNPPPDAQREAGLVMLRKAMEAK